MTAYLRLRNMDMWGKVVSANLQIGVNQGMDGNPLGWFEIKGDNAGADGGTWEWGRNRYNFVCIKLTSNKFKTIIGELTSRDWGKGIVPPQQPFFRQSSEGYFQYIFPGYGRGISCDWWITKLLG